MLIQNNNILLATIEIRGTWEKEHFATPANKYAKNRISLDAVFLC